MIDHLPRAYADGSYLDARAQMMSAAMMGATGFQKGLGAIHAMSHPIGAIFHTHHGTTNAVCMPAVLTLNAPAIRDRFDEASPYLASNLLAALTGPIRALQIRQTVTHSARTSP